MFYGNFAAAADDDKNENENENHTHTQKLFFCYLSPSLNRFIKIYLPFVFPYQFYPIDDDPQMIMMMKRTKKKKIIWPSSSSLSFRSWLAGNLPGTER